MANITDPLTLLTGDRAIDKLFGNGLQPGQITEIFGKSGTGKSGFALQMCLQVQLSADQGGLDGSAIYISTSGRFSITRLEQIIQSRFDVEDPSDLLEQIRILHIRDLETQNHLLKYQVPHAMEKYNVKLLVIDSITANFRVTDESAESSKASMIFETGEILRNLARRFNAVVLTINEVSARFSSVKRIAQDTHSAFLPLGNDPGDLYDYGPALGVAGSMLSNSRIRFHRNESTNERIMECLYSPQAPFSNCKFVITSGGLESEEC